MIIGGESQNDSAHRCLDVLVAVDLGYPLCATICSNRKIKDFVFMNENTKTNLSQI